MSDLKFVSSLLYEKRESDMSQRIRTPIGQTTNGGSQAMTQKAVMPGDIGCAGELDQSMTFLCCSSITFLFVRP